MDKEVVGLQGYADKRAIISINDWFLDGVSPTIVVLQNNDMHLFVVVAKAKIISNRQLYLFVKSTINICLNHQWMGS
jgi:hypothetical protein